MTITICCLCGICHLWGISKVLGISSSCIQAVANVITAIVAIIAFCYSKMEYELHIECEKAATLWQGTRSTCKVSESLRLT